MKLKITFRPALAALTALSVLAGAAPPAAAQQGVAIIRDAETEQLLREYVTPIFRAAGINTNAAKIILVGNRSFNAFVANGQKIFINTGALMEAKTPNEIIGVLAHESGHIAGGHLVRLHQELAWRSRACWWAPARSPRRCRPRAAADARRRSAWTKPA